MQTNISAYFTLRDSSHTDTALAHFLKGAGRLPEHVNPADALDVHFASRSIEIDVRSGAQLAASLAGYGVCPSTRNQSISEAIARECVDMIPNIPQVGARGWVVGDAVILVFPHLMGMVVHTSELENAVIVAKNIVQKFKLVQ